jgi:hypothetical protein
MTKKLFEYEKRLRKFQKTYFSQYKLELDYSTSNSVLAYTYGPYAPPDGPEYLTIYVSKRVLKKFDDDMLLSTLYHEQGHIEDPDFDEHSCSLVKWILAGNPWGQFFGFSTIPAQEIYADAYALHKMYWHFRKMKLPKEEITERMAPLIDAANAYSGRLDWKVFDDTINYGRSVGYIIENLSPGSLFSSAFPCMFR